MNHHKIPSIHTGCLRVAIFAPKIQGDTYMPQPIWFTTMLDKLSPDVLEEWDERSGILQYDAGFGREHSECLALLLVISNHKLIL